MTKRLLTLLAASVLAVTVVTANTACDPSGQRVAAPPSPRSIPLATPVVGEWTNTAQVPPGFQPLSIEFGDAENGYALFTRCGPADCEARLLTTGDGGRNWTPRDHPGPRAKNHQLYVGEDRTVVLLAEPHAWYVSRDGAASWQRRPYDVRGALPGEYYAHNGQFYLDCPQDRSGGCAIRDWRAGDSWRQPLTSDLEYATSLTSGRDGRWWLAGIENGRVVTAVSRIAVRGFTLVPVPPQSGNRLLRAWVAASADGNDLWLIAEREPTGAAGGQGGGLMIPALLKPTGLPLVWHYQHGSAGGSWVPRPITGIGEQAGAPYSMAPAGGGLMAVAGPEVSGYLDRNGRYLPVPGGPRLDWVGQLPDGTLFGKTNEPSVTYLAADRSPRHGWIKVVLTAPR